MVTALGGAIAALGLFETSFWLFATGLLVIGLGGAFVQQYRFAAADASPKIFKPKAISWVLGGGVFAAIIGPQAVIHTKNLFAPVEFAGAFVAVIGLGLLGALILSTLKIADHGAAFDIQAVCTGFIYALTTADTYVRAGLARRVLVIGAETYSRILDWNDRRTAVLFGDGAGAVVVEEAHGNGLTSDTGILAAHLRSDGRHKEKLYVDGGPSTTQTTGHLRMTRPLMWRVMSALAWLARAEKPPAEAMAVCTVMISGTCLWRSDSA